MQGAAPCVTILLGCSAGNGPIAAGTAPAQVLQLRLKLESGQKYFFQKGCVMGITRAASAVLAGKALMAAPVISVLPACSGLVVPT